MNYNTKYNKKQLIDYIASNCKVMDQKSASKFLNEIKKMDNDSKSMLDIAQEVYINENSKHIYNEKSLLDDLMDINNRNDDISYDNSEKYNNALNKQGAYRELARLGSLENRQNNIGAVASYDYNIKQLNDIVKDEKKEQLHERLKEVPKALYLNYDFDKLGSIKGVAKNKDKEYNKITQEDIDNSKLTKEDIKKIYGNELEDALKRKNNNSILDQMDLQQKNKQLETLINNKKITLESKQNKTKISPRTKSAISETEHKRMQQDALQSVVDFGVGFVPGLGYISSYEKRNNESDKNYLLNYKPGNGSDRVVDYSINAAKTLMDYFASKKGKEIMKGDTGGKFEEEVGDLFGGQIFNSLSPALDKYVFKPIGDKFKNLFKYLKGVDDER